MYDDLFEFAARQQQPQAEPEPEPVVKRNPKAAIPLPVDLIRESMELDETSPTFLRWKVRPRHHFATERDWRWWNGRFSNKTAGMVAKIGDTAYYLVGIGGTRYRAHRLVWLLAHGYDPGVGFIDHKNGNGLENHPNNLRLATIVENNRNKAKQRNNSSGVPGVRWCKRDQKWQSLITVNRRDIHLGYFTSFDDAVAARKSAEEKHFGAFAFDASRSRSRNAA